MEKAVLLARVSSREQEQGYSLSAQEKLLREYADRENLKIVKPFVFTESAKDSNKRKEFKKMLVLLNERDDITCLLCEKVDRLTRNLSDAVEVNNWIEKNPNNKVIFVKQNLTISKDSKSNDKFQWDIHTVMARNYINNLSDEIKKGMKEKAAEGIYPNCAPLGYLNDQDKKGKRDFRFIIVDEVRAPLIRKMFEYYATGNYSLKKLRETIYTDGLRTRKGNKLSVHGIDAILKNPFYISQYVWKGEKYQGTHPSLVDKSLFDFVQTMIGKHSAGKFRKHNFTYKGLLKCGVCGGNCCGEIQKNYIYYKCTNWRPCNQKHYTREEIISEQIITMLDSLKIPNEIIQSITETLKDNHLSEKDFHDKIMSDLQRRLTNLEKRFNALYDDKLDGKISFEFFEKKQKEFESEKEEILKEMDKYSKASINYADTGAKILELAKRAKEIYLSRTAEEKRSLLSFVVSKLVLKDGKLEFVYKKPFDIIIERSKSKKLWTLADDFRTLDWVQILPAYDFNLAQIGQLLQV